MRSTAFERPARRLDLDVVVLSGSLDGLLGRRRALTAESHGRRHPQLMDTERPGRRRWCLWMVNDDSAVPSGASRVTFEEAPPGDAERSAALDGWVAAFDREMQQCGDFATSVTAMTAHGCFDVRAVVERWILANPSGGATLAQPQPAPQEPVPLELVLEVVAPLAEAGAPAAPAVDEERTSPRPEAGSSPDIAYFHSLLRGGIERAQIYEAFPEFRLAIDEAIGQYGASAPILSEVPPAPSREDLNDEIRDMRQEFQASRKRERRRWRRD